MCHPIFVLCFFKTSTNRDSSSSVKELLMTTGLASFYYKNTYFKCFSKIFRSTSAFSVGMSFFSSSNTNFSKGLPFNPSNSSRHFCNSFSSSCVRQSMGSAEWVQWIHELVFSATSQGNVLKLHSRTYPRIDEMRKLLLCLQLSWIQENVSSELSPPLPPMSSDYFHWKIAAIF